MKNMVILYKTEDGGIYCQQITKKGKEYVEADMPGHGCWDDGGTIVLSELEEILNREI